MSIYSGFATRGQEETYDQLIEDLVFVLQKRLLKFYNKEQANEMKFLDVLVRIHQQMSKMEESKYLEPKMSKSFQDILRFLIKSPLCYESGENELKSPCFTEKPNDNTKVKNLTTRNNSVHLPEEKNISVGKIVKQCAQMTEKSEHDEAQGLSESRNTFVNPKKKEKNRIEISSPVKRETKNPEEVNNNVNLFSTSYKFKSRFEKFMSENKKEVTLPANLGSLGMAFRNKTFTSSVRKSSSERSQTKDMKNISQDIIKEKESSKEKETQKEKSVEKIVGSLEKNKNINRGHRTRSIRNSHVNIDIDQSCFG